MHLLQRIVHLLGVFTGIHPTLLTPIAESTCGRNSLSNLPAPSHPEIRGLGQTMIVYLEILGTSDGEVSVIYSHRR